MDLPQELIDEIIDHVLSDGEESLRNCSLAARSWIHPSQRRIFESVTTLGAARLKLWLNTISPTNVKILQHVRSLSCQIDGAG